VSIQKRAKLTGKGKQERFLALPYVVVNSPKYCSLSPIAVKLLIDLYSQYNGNNNGDLAYAFSLMKPRGWKSKATLQKAKNELLAAGFIEQTRQGGRNWCSLFSVTWRATDDCKGKLEVPATRVSSGAWKGDASSPNASGK